MLEEMALRDQQDQQDRQVRQAQQGLLELDLQDHLGLQVLLVQQLLLAFTVHLLDLLDQTLQYRI